MEKSDNLAGRRVSRAPDGVGYALPEEKECEQGLVELERAVAGRRVVVVQGLGFVGAAVATAVAAAKNSDGSPKYWVIGVDLATEASWWKVASLREGRSPFASADEEFARLLAEAVSRGNLTATADERVYGLAEVILIDVQLDVASGLGGGEKIEVDLEPYREALEVVGRWMRPEALVLVETTVPVGMCREVVRPVLEGCRAERGIGGGLRLAHAYERVMPGKRYLESIRNFWRVVAADDEDAGRAAQEFLESIRGGENFPVRRLAGTTASELAKLLENSYRAANIAFIHEWTVLAEKVGVNLWEVVDAIRVRRGTHDNMRYPGFGVGGYCLTKDSYLAKWGAENLLGVEADLPVTLSALRTNFMMPLHTLGQVEEVCADLPGGRKILLAGVSYLAEVADTRNSPAEVFVGEVLARGGEVVYHDPLVGNWEEGAAVPRVENLPEGLAGVDVVVFAVAHGGYRELAVEDFPEGLRIVDAANVIDDEKAAALRGRGCRLIGAGKGHWRVFGWQNKP